MSWRSITALLILAFAGGAGGFAYLSANGQLPWATKAAPATVAVPEPKDEIASLVPSSAFRRANDCSTKRHSSRGDAAGQGRA